MSDKEERDYHCYYCGNDFKQMVGTSGSHEPHISNNHISSQVRCRCGNFLKTWEEK